MAEELSIYCDKFNRLPDSQFGSRKGLGTCDALLTLSHDLQSLDRGHESRVVAIDFSSAFDVNHKAQIYNLQLLGVGGSLLSISKFLTNQLQCVVVDGAALLLCLLLLVFLRAVSLDLYFLTFLFLTWALTSKISLFHMLVIQLYTPLFTLLATEVKLH